MKKSIENSEHYIWGDHCSGWHLLRTPELSVIQESMLPNTQETPHYHDTSQQFFYILKGNATFLIDDKVITINAGEGLHVRPRTNHQIKNTSSDILDFLVISQPTTQDDRYPKPIETL